MKLSLKFIDFHFDPWLNCKMMLHSVLTESFATLLLYEVDTIMYQVSYACSRLMYLKECSTKYTLYMVSPLKLIATLMISPSIALDKAQDLLTLFGIFIAYPRCVWSEKTCSGCSMSSPNKKCKWKNHIIGDIDDKR